MLESQCRICCGSEKEAMSLVSTLFCFWIGQPIEPSIFQVKVKWMSYQEMGNTSLIRTSQYIFKLS